MPQESIAALHLDSGEYWSLLGMKKNGVAQQITVILSPHLCDLGDETEAKILGPFSIYDPVLLPDYRVEQYRKEGIAPL